MKITIKKVKGVVLDFCDRWSVEEKPPTPLGAIFGIFFFASVIIYAVYLGLLLKKAPPVETSLLESTGKLVYNITLQCVDLAAVARDETPTYNYDLSGSGADSSLSGTDTGDDSDTSTDTSSCNNLETCYLSENSTLNCGVIDDPNADCLSCGACDVCFDTFDSSITCDNFTWVEGSRKRASEGFVAATDTCIVKYKFLKGSPCYTKAAAGAEKTINLSLNQTTTIAICNPKQGRDYFNMYVSDSTKFFVVGSQSDYEIYGYPDESDTVLLNRLRTDDRTSKTSQVSDVWYGIPIDTSTSSESTVSLQLAPIFDVIILAPAFTWVGWAGQVGGIAGAFGSAWGIAFAIFAWSLSMVRPHNKIGVAARKSSTNDLELNDEPK